MFSRVMVLAVGAACAGPASAVVLVNGDFESFTGAFAVNGTALVLPAQTTLTGWTAVVETAVLRSGNTFGLTPASGDQFLDLTSGRPLGQGGGRGVQQTLTGLVAGATYSLSFALGVSNAPCVGGGINCTGPITVAVDAGGAGQTFVHDSALPGNVWGYYAMDFVAGHSEALLTFSLTSAPGYYAGLDDVSVSVVPEPATYASMALGLLAVGAAARRRARRAVTRARLA